MNVHRSARALPLFAAIALLLGACGTTRDGGETAAEAAVVDEVVTDVPLAEAPVGGIVVTERDAGTAAATLTMPDGTVVEVAGDEFDAVIASVTGSERFVNNIYQGSFGADDERYILGQMIMEQVFEYAVTDAGAAIDPDSVETQKELLTSDLSQAMLNEPDPEAAAAEVVTEIEPYVDMLSGLIASQAALDAQLAAGLEETEVVMQCGRHILVETETEAVDLMSQLDEGADFAELAIEFSIDTGSGAQGGDLGCADASNYVPTFAAAMETAAIDEIVGPVPSDYGFHIITVYERKTETVMPDTSAAMESMISGIVSGTEIVVDPVLGAWDSTSFAVIPA